MDPFTPNTFSEGELALYGGILHVCLRTYSGDNPTLIRLLELGTTGQSVTVEREAIVSPHRLVWKAKINNHEATSLRYYAGACRETHSRFKMADAYISDKSDLSNPYPAHSRDLHVLPFDQGELVLHTGYPGVAFLVTKLLRGKGDAFKRELTPVFGQESSEHPGLLLESRENLLRTIRTLRLETSQGDAEDVVHSYPDTQYYGHGRKLGEVFCMNKEKVVSVDVLDTGITFMTDFRTFTNEGTESISGSKSGDDRDLPPLTNVVPDESASEASLTPAAVSAESVTEAKSTSARDMRELLAVPPANLLKGDFVQWTEDGQTLTGRFKNVRDERLAAVVRPKEWGLDEQPWWAPLPLFSFPVEERELDRQCYALCQTLRRELFVQANRALTGNTGPFKGLTDQGHFLALQDLRLSFLRGTDRLPGRYDFGLFVRDDKTPMVEASFLARSQTLPARVRVHSFKEYDFNLFEAVSNSREVVKTLAREYVKNVKKPPGGSRPAYVPPPARQLERYGSLSRMEYEDAQHELALSQGRGWSRTDYVPPQRNEPAPRPNKTREELGGAAMDFVQRTNGKVNVWRDDYGRDKSTPYCISMNNLRCSPEKAREVLDILRALIEPVPLRAVVADEEELTV